MLKSSDDLKDAACGSQRPQRRVRHLRSIAVRNLVLETALKAQEGQDDQLITGTLRHTLAAFS